MFNSIKLRLELRIFLIGIKIIDWLIKDDYEMEFFPDLYEAPLMIFITGWLIEKVQTTGFVGDVFNLTKERIRQIEKHAIVRMQHPTRMRKLEAYIA